MAIGLKLKIKRPVRRLNKTWSGTKKEDKHGMVEDKHMTG
jgi:hypothetical protein